MAKKNNENKTRQEELKKIRLIIKSVLQAVNKKNKDWSQYRFIKCD